MPSVEIVVAIAKNNAIGINGQIPWHLSSDLKRFKEITTPYPMIMGKRTILSIGKALPNRRNIVITSKDDIGIDGIEIVHSFKEALDLCHDCEKVMIVGGARVYKEALSIANVLHLTVLDKEFEGDTFFPDFKDLNFKKIDSETYHDDTLDCDYSYETWVRS